MRHTLIALVQDEPLALSRIVGLLTRRGFTIEGIAVGASETAGVNRLTLVVEANVVDQVAKQLERLVPVLAVLPTDAAGAVERETALVRMQAPISLRVRTLCTAFGARIIAEGDSMLIEMSAAPTDVEEFLTLLTPLGVQEVARSGRIAMLRRSEAHHTAASRRVDILNHQPGPDHGRIALR